MSNDMVQGSSKDMLADESYDLPPPLKKLRKSKDKEGKKKSKKVKAEEANGNNNESTVDMSQQQTLDVDIQTPVQDRPERSSDFKSVNATSRFPLAPVFAQDLLDGVRQCLQSWIMR